MKHTPQSQCILVCNSNNSFDLYSTTIVANRSWAAVCLGRVLPNTVVRDYSSHCAVLQFPTDNRHVKVYQTETNVTNQEIPPQ